MTNAEKLSIKTAKAQFNTARRNKFVHNETRNDLIRLFLGQPVPNWASIRFNVTKLGI